MSQQAPQQRARIADENGLCTREWYTYFSIGGTAGQSFTFATLPSNPSLGATVVITDSPVNTWAATITAGGGPNIVLAWWNSGGWRVMGA